jgi:hypothetical protein
VDLLTIKELGGWKALAMVTRYAHVSSGRLREGIERSVAGPEMVGPDTATDAEAAAERAAAI